MEGLAQSQAVILGTVAVIILLIVIVGAVKGRGKGWKWIIGLIIAAALGYLLISAEVLNIP